MSIWNPSVVVVASNGILQCPRCGDQYLHSGRIQTFDRPKEDATSGRIVTVGKDVLVEERANVDGNSRNPSLRRHGIAIAFSCECCGDDLELTLAQHKGATLIGWRETR